MKKIFLVLLGISLAFVFAETILRFGGWIFYAKQDLENYLSMKERGEYTILCLGESTTALGGKESWPTQLGEILNQQPGKLMARVINQGIPGGDSTAIVERLAGALDKYQPDMVIAMMGVNDQGEILPYGDNDGPDKKQSWSRMRTVSLIRLIFMRTARFAAKEKENTAPEGEGECFQSGWNAFFQGDIALAKRKFAETLELNPANAGAYMALGDCYDLTGEHKVAAEMFAKALVLAPDNADIYVKLGWVYNGEKQFGPAEKLFQEAIKLAPENDLARVRLGRCYYDGKQYEKAETVYLEAIAVNPGTSAAYGELGKLYLESGQLEKAVEVFSRALEKTPDNDDVWGVLALTNLENKNYSQSEKCFLASDRLRRKTYCASTRRNYAKLKKLTLDRGIRLVCVQYPMRGIGPLISMVGDKDKVVFVDNEAVFKQAVRKCGYFEYFSDLFAGDFGHCTAQGNRLLAENIAVVLKEQARGFR